MMRNWKQIAGLGAVLLALGALATWDEWKTKKDEKEKETKGLLLQIKPESVVGIMFHSSGDGESGDKIPTQAADPAKIVDVTLKLNSGKWEITAPVQTSADQQTITDLLKSLTDYKSESEVAASKDQWAQFGLSNPRRSIQLETNDGKKITFMVGINAPVGFSVYTATSDSDTVFAGSQYIATSTGKTLFDLRDKKFVSVNPSEITGFKILRKLEPLTLAKSDGKWTIHSPTSILADTTSVNNLLDDISGLKAAEFFDSPPKDLADALSDGKVSLQIELTGEKLSKSLRVGEHNGAIYAQITGSPTIFKLHDDAKGKISKTLKDLRDKRIFSFQSNDIQSVVIDGETFNKVTDDWYTKDNAAKFSPDGKFTGKQEDKPKASAHVRGLIVDLEYAKAEEVYEPSNALVKNLPKAPKHQIKLEFGPKESKSVALNVWLAEDNPEMIYVKVDGVAQVYKVKRTTITSIAPSTTAPVGNEAMGPTTPAVGPEGLSN